MTIKISFKPDGPLLVQTEGEDFPVLRSADGPEVQLGKVAALCRCGVSQKKPFCDGAHVKDGYRDANRCENDVLQNYETAEITVHFNRSICSGAAQCVHSLPAVFKNASVDWIHPAAAPVAEVVKAVEGCPSGALSYTIGDQTHIKEATATVFKVVPHGPYEITGPVDLAVTKWSQNASRTRFALCRCGKSANNPFCDYSHGEQGWRDDT